MCLLFISSFTHLFLLFQEVKLHYSGTENIKNLEPSIMGIDMLEPGTSLKQLNQSNVKISHTQWHEQFLIFYDPIMLKTEYYA